MSKIIKARLKENPTAYVDFEINFDNNWLDGSAVVVRLKNKLFHEIKNALHEKIAVLSLDDIDFKIE